MYDLYVRYMGKQDYNAVFEKMRDFTQQRTPASVDEMWCLQHPAVFTLGANADTAMAARIEDAAKRIRKAEIDRIFAPND